MLSPVTLGTSAAEMIKLKIRTVGDRAILEKECPQTWTITDVKTWLAAAHPSTPPPSKVRLIHGGECMADETTLVSRLRNRRLSGGHDLDVSERSELASEAGDGTASTAAFTPVLIFQLVVESDHKSKTVSPTPADAPAAAAIPESSVSDSRQAGVPEEQRNGGGTRPRVQIRVDVPDGSAVVVNPGANTYVRAQTDTANRPQHRQQSQQRHQPHTRSPRSQRYVHNHHRQQQQSHHLRCGYSSAHNAVERPRDSHRVMRPAWMEGMDHLNEARRQLAHLADLHQWRAEQGGDAEDSELTSSSPHARPEGAEMGGEGGGVANPLDENRPTVHNERNHANDDSNSEGRVVYREQGDAPAEAEVHVARAEVRAEPVANGEEGRDVERDMRILALRWDTAWKIIRLTFLMYLFTMDSAVPSVRRYFLWAGLSVYAIFQIYFAVYYPIEEPEAAVNNAANGGPRNVRNEGNNGNNNNNADNNADEAGIRRDGPHGAARGEESEDDEEEPEPFITSFERTLVSFLVSLVPGAEENPLENQQRQLDQVRAM